MNSLGIVRKLDHLGRICIPKELRDGMNIVQGTMVEIFVDGEKIVLRFRLPEQLSQSVDANKSPPLSHAVRVSVKKKKRRE